MKWMGKENETASEEGRRRTENLEDVVRVYVLWEEDDIEISMYWSESSLLLT